MAKFGVSGGRWALKVPMGPCVGLWKFIHSHLTQFSRFVTFEMGMALLISYGMMFGFLRAF